MEQINQYDPGDYFIISVTMIFMISLDWHHINSKQL